MKTGDIFLSLFRLGAVTITGGMLLLSPRSTLAQGLAGTPEQRAEQSKT